MMTETEWDATYGESTWGIDEDQARVALADRRLWTQVEGASGASYLMAGYWRVNAIQYVIAERPWPHVDVATVKLDGPDDE